MQDKILPDYSFFPQRIQELVAFVDQCHDQQFRKYSGLRYVHHLVAVAKTIQEYTKDEKLMAVALCHDLYEDTDCTESALIAELGKLGFVKKEINFINDKVKDLSDVFIKDDYPEWNRRKRKKAEAERLWKVSPEAQTVKYADIKDNSVDLSNNDPGFARRYLEEAHQILSGMDKGHSELYKEVLKTVKSCEAQLKKSK